MEKRALKRLGREKKKQVCVIPSYSFMHFPVKFYLYEDSSRATILFNIATKP